ncbi:MAG: DUF2179 domain-containing protein [Chloroflexi bacterium]|nr:DUF2179 domain-containing protein [Chloroflexota bacterium]
MDILLQALLIFVLRVLGISVSTLATTLTVRGNKAGAIAAGSVGALVYVLAIAPVVTNLNRVPYLVAYVAGFAVGTWVGMMMEQRMALGYAEVRIISSERYDQVAEAIRQAGYGVTQLVGQGRDRAVGILEIIVPRRRVAEVTRLAESIDGNVIVSVSEARTVQRAYWRPDRRI